MLMRTHKDEAFPRLTWPAAGVAMFLILWGTSLLGGYLVMSTYATTPGSQAHTPVDWPRSSVLAQGEGSWNLVMFVHPFCPCSKASLEELNAVLQDGYGTPLRLYVDFLSVDLQDGPITDSATWKAAGAIPNVIRYVDSTGAEAQRFGAMTSGFLVLYDPQGHLKFSGGITGSRGEVGENAGFDMVRGILAGKITGVSHHAVFGCSLPQSYFTTTSNNLAPSNP